MARRLGTSRCSVIRPNEIRRGAKALDELLVFAGREAAKMRPSEDRWCGGRYASSRTDPGRKAPSDGHPTTGVCRQTAQTSSVAERLTAVQSPPAGNRNAPERCYPIAPAGLATRALARSRDAVASAEGCAGSACLDRGHPVKGYRPGTPGVRLSYPAEGAQNIRKDGRSGVTRSDRPDA